MGYSADFLIQKRKDKWNELHSIEFDKELRNAIADEMLTNEDLLAEVKRNPEKLIEMVPIWELKCNMEPEAARLSYNTMSNV